MFFTFLSIGMIWCFLFSFLVSFIIFNSAFMLSREVSIAWSILIAEGCTIFFVVYSIVNVRRMMEKEKKEHLKK